MLCGSALWGEETFVFRSLECCVAVLCGEMRHLCLGRWSAVW